VEPLRESGTMEDNSLEESLKLLQNCTELESLERKLKQFNVFDVLRLGDQESCHSNFLAWLLDPNQNHGLANLFLQKWLQQAFKTSDLADPLGLDEYSFEHVQVLREWNYVDLLIKIETPNKKPLVIAIENKTWSIQHSNQLTRYHKRVTEAYPHAKCFFVLLSVNREDPKDDRFRIATYEQVRKTLKKCLDESPNGIKDEPRLIIEHYIQLIRDKFMPNPDIEELARKIYTDHRQALDVIFRLRPSNILREAVVNEIVADKSLGLRFLGPKKGELIYLMPISWDTDKNETGEIVYLQLELGSRLTLKGLMGKVDPTWRSETFALLTMPNWPKELTNQSLAVKWVTFYKSEIELEGIDPEAAKVMQWLKMEMEIPEFGKILQTVANRLTPRRADLSAN
jgi:hypothetical protein